MPDSRTAGARAERAPSLPGRAAATAWTGRGLDLIDLVRRGLTVAREVLADVVSAVDGHEGSRRNAVHAVTADAARARARTEVARALAEAPGGPPGT